MNTDEAGRILRLRLDLTEQRYSQQTIDAWTQALEDVTEHDARDAIHALVHDGQTSITVPAIRGWLRNTRHARANYEQAQTSTLPPPVEQLPKERIAAILAVNIQLGRDEHDTHLAGTDPEAYRRMQRHRKATAT